MGLEKAGRVVKSLSPGAPGTKQWQERYGDRLVRVRYRGNAKRRVRSTTVEIIVEEAYWDPEGHPFLSVDDENLVKGLDRQAMDLFKFRLSFHLAGLLSIYEILPIHSNTTCHLAQL